MNRREMGMAPFGCMRSWSAYRLVCRILGSILLLAAATKVAEARNYAFSPDPLIGHPLLMALLVAG